MTRTPSFSARQIARLRAQALGIGGTGPVAPTPAAVVDHHLAMQAQDFRASRWAIGSRLAEPATDHAARPPTDADVLAAYDAGEIVRSWPMRGTVHVTRAHDLPWMLSLMGTRALSGVRRRWEVLGIGERELEGARDVAVQLLRGGGRATRAEFGEALAESGLDLSGLRSYHTVWYLCQTGTLVQGPTRNGEHELVLLDEWIPEPRVLDRDEAIRELGLRYLQARGPARVDDLVHWTKLPKRDCRTALAPDGEAIVEVEGPDGPYAMRAEHLDRLDPDAPSVDRAVRALAAFDEHLLGYRHRDAVLDPEHARLVDPGRNGVFRWTIVSGGRVVATWRRTRRTRRTVVEVQPFSRLPARVASRLPGALEAWARFEGTEVELRVP